MPESGGGIDWKRTGLIVGGIAALALVWQEPWENSGGDDDSSVSISIGDDDRAENTLTIQNDEGEIVTIDRQVEEGVDQAVESATGALGGVAAEGGDNIVASSDAPDWDSFEAEMNRLGARMEELESQLEEPGADRDAIEEEMGQVGRQMALTGVDAASEAIKEAIR
ncbi:hypothetical protein KCG44_05395 [Pacificimonas sp. WHA3]|uniref:Uncharacterized protein n=1 Tax=Pacificimonas pallii TaxID=2827236 RepID=A0ABS6SE76_9SPHN|nr:hypothetical protein [Pacificimonas pallii]MBV7256216.1 hypothetical protein [Pacificimonas pallii]